MTGAMDLRPVFHAIGVLLSALGVSMLVPAAADLGVGHDDWQVFAAAASGTFFVGMALALSARGSTARFSVRHIFLLTTLSWVMLTVFAALPLAWCELGLSFTDAFFEAMSGVTTTGSTVIVGLDGAPPGILLWRALLQWFGGIGFVVVAIAVLPELRIGGMDLFRAESSEKTQKLLPRATQIATSIGAIYLALTGLCALLYWSAGMSGFDATVHAMTTVATGGFSSHDASVGYFASDRLEWIAVIFMALGGIPFMLFLQAIRGNPLALYSDSQVRWYVSILGISTAVLAAWKAATLDVPMLDAVRLAAFNTVSIMTGTGYTSGDFTQWGAFALILFFLLMFVGGCAGSTTCGLKVFRMQVLYLTAQAQLLRLIRPHGVFVPRYNGIAIQHGVAEAVMGFFFLFVLSFGVVAMLLGLCGLDFLTSVSGAATAIANVGPGLSDTIGPNGSFAPLPDAAKWILSTAMLLGRLELLTVLVLLTPAFWRD